MKFTFDLQRFDEVSISAGDTYELDGVTYTALEDSRLNLDDDGKVSGITSGKVQTTVTNKENSPTVIFDAAENATPFNLAEDNGALALTLNGRTFKFTEGNAAVKGDNVTTGAATFYVAGTHSNADYEFRVENAADFSITADAFVISSEKFYVSAFTGGATLEFGVSGTAIRNFTNHTFAFTGGTTISNTFGNYTFSATADDKAGGGFSFTSQGITFTPSDSDGSLSISVMRGNTPVFARELSVSGGSIFVNHANRTIGITDGTTISLALRDYELIATANGDASTIFSITDNGIVIQPNTGDGTLDLTLKSDNGSLNANLELVSGSFILGEGGKLTVTKGTELKVDFGGGYIVNFKATNDAGGAISIGENGITFNPNSGDGGLEISVTRDGQTRSASLDVTGSVTYKLDGSISLAQGTVVRNVFEDGNTLTITANTDSSGSLVFSPQNGLTITPSTADALTVSLSSEGVGDLIFTSITGSINYNGGRVTASDGASAHIVDETYTDYSVDLSVVGGSASISFSLVTGDVYSANDGATLTWKYPDGTTFDLQNGSLTSIYGDTLEDNTNIISAGATFRSNDDEYAYTLGKAGNYTLNGMNVTTTKDNTEVTLNNYDTVTFEADAGIVFDGQEFSGDGLITLTNGGIVIENADDNVAVDGTAFNDRITNSGDNVTINALGGNDTINSSGNGVKIDGGAGSNLVSLFGGDEGSEIVFDGVTSVEGFKTGWGSGSDTIYLNTGSDPAVDFKSIGLTFYDGSDSLTLDDVDETAKVHLYYEEIDWLRKGVFIARNDWYTVSDSDLTVDSGEGIYFVGTSATHNHGVDFSGVSQALNVSMNTDYDAANNSIWVNNVYSIRGGAGNTTITGTDDSDTIIAGTGRTTIDGAGGNDRISLGSAQVLVKFTSGGGNDSIYGFNANSTISIGGADYSSATSGNDLILNVGSDYVTLFGAASLNNPHIIGTSAGGSSSSTTSGGGSSSSTTSGGGSSSSPTTSGGSSSSTTTSGGSSTSTTSSGSSSSSNRTYYGNSNGFTFRQNDHSTTANASTTDNAPVATSNANQLLTPTSYLQTVYSGGDQVISNYTAGEKIALGTYPTGGAFVNGNFVLSSASGNLVVQNAAGKVVTFTDGNGNDFIKAYEATAAGVIDGRGLTGFELINGSAGNDWIYAGDGGSSLWGGSGAASDMLVGGAGTDIFVVGKNQGADVISNAETKDIINISDATLSDIIATAENDGLIAVTFNNGNAVAVQSSEALSAAFTLADGSAYRFNHATKAWQSA